MQPTACCQYGTPGVFSLPYMRSYSARLVPFAVVLEQPSVKKVTLLVLLLDYSATCRRSSC